MYHPYKNSTRVKERFKRRKKNIFLVWGEVVIERMYFDIVVVIGEAWYFWEE